MMKYIVTINEDARQKQVGVKAWNLLQLTSKFRVPELLVITTKAFKEYEREGRMSGRLIDKQRRQILYLKVVKEFLLLWKNLRCYQESPLVLAKSKHGQGW
jgi:phosphoenolpyruvate synthase/pyruvate phosphate dikinase